MHKKSKLCTLMLSALFMLAMPLSACRGNEGSSQIENSVKLVDFESVTETVGLGEDYALPSGVVFDEAGNDYRVTYEVKDAKGEKVTLSNGRFKVKEMGEAKYVITCSAEVAGQYVTRTITLNVVDRGAPTITNETMPFAFVGEQYTIQGIKVSDNTQEVITPSYQVFDTQDKAVTVTNGTFTPTSKGEYTLKVTATDAAGNVGEKDIPIYVREPMGAYVLENFNDEYGLPVFSVKEAGYTEDDVVYHETFDPTPDNAANGDTRTGVAEGNSVLSSSADYGAHYYFKFDSTFSEIGDFEYIYLKAYIKSSVGEYKPQVTLFSGNEALGAGSGTQYNVNEWVEIRLTLEDICAPDSTFANPDEMRDGETPLDCFFRKMTSESGYYLFWIPNYEYTVGETTEKDNANNYILYVDEIGYKPVFNPTADVEESYDLGEWVTIDPTVVTDQAASEYSIDVKVTSPSGEEVTLTDKKFRLIETGDYTVELIYVSGKFNGYTKYVISAISTKTITIGEYTGEPMQGDVITIPTATFDGGTVTASVSIDGQEVEMETENTFTAKVAGDYVITYASDIDGLIYKKSMTISVERAAYETNEVISFGSKEELVNNTASAGVETQWLYSFAGEYGVVKLTSNGNGEDWSYFAFQNMQEMHVYSGYTYMVVRMYIPSSAQVLSSSITFGNDAVTIAVPNVRDKWVDIAIPYEKFNTAWGIDEFNEYRKNLALDFIGDIYVAGAFMTNDAPLTATQVLSFSNASQLVNTQGYNAQIECLSEYAGKSGVAKVTSTANWAYFGFTPWQDISAYEGAKFLVIRMYIAEGFVGSLYLGDANNCMTAIKTGEWVDYYFPGAHFLEKWANSATAFDIWYNALSFESGEIYIDEIFVEMGNWENDLDVLSFAEETQIENTESYNSQIEWLAEYAGKTGVAKVTSTADWSYFGFKPSMDMLEYYGYKYLVIRMYITEGFEGPLYLGDANNCMTAIKTGEWVDYYFPCEHFFDKWENVETNFDIWYNALSFESGEVYIDGIFVTNAEPQAN